MKYTKTLVTGAIIVGASVITLQSVSARILVPSYFGFVNSLSNSIYPTIAPVFNTENISKTIPFGSGDTIDLGNVLKNTSEITDGENTLKYTLKDVEKYNGVSYSEDTRAITIDKTVKSGEIKLNFEVCTEGKEIVAEEPKLPSIYGYKIHEIPIEDEE